LSVGSTHEPLTRSEDDLEDSKPTISHWAGLKIHSNQSGYRNFTLSKDRVDWQVTSRKRPVPQGKVTSVPYTFHPHQPT